MTARVLYLAKADALSSRPVRGTLGYFNEALLWFHSAVSERVFAFMLPKAEDKRGNIGRRPDYFRKEAALSLEKLVYLSVAKNEAAVDGLTAAVRAAAEQHLVQRYLELLGPYDEYQSTAEFGHCLQILKAGATFTALLAEPKYVHLSTEVAYAHEIRLRDFAALTTGLCS
jgi:hypothetical protein